MILLLLCGAISVVGIIMVIFGQARVPLIYFAGVAFIIIGILALITALLMIPVQRTEIRAQIAAYNAARETINYFTPGHFGEVEKHIIQSSMIRLNSWLASTQYYSKTRMYNLYFPKEISRIKPILYIR